jgi:cold shock CspA family protein
MSERMAGTVAKMILTRGFGFIVGDADGEDYMMHVDEVHESIQWESIRKGARVTFTPQRNGGKGNKLRAMDVRLAQE